MAEIALLAFIIWCGIGSLIIFVALAVTGGLGSRYYHRDRAQQHRFDILYREQQEIAKIMKERLDNFNEM